MFNNHRVAQFALRFFISVFVLYIGLGAFIPDPALAFDSEDAAKLGFDVYEAYHLIQYGNYDFIVNEFESPADIFLDEIDSPYWTAYLAEWHLATFSISSAVDYATKEVGYYDTLLMDILFDDKCESLATSHISFAGDMASEAEDMAKCVSASVHKKVMDAGLSLSDYKSFSDPNQDNSKLFEQLVGMGELYDAMEILDDVTNYLGYFSDGIDLVEKLSKLQVLAQSSKESAEVIDEMRSKCSRTSPMYWALTDYYNAMISTSLTRDDVIKIFTLKTGFKDVASKLASESWKRVVEAMGTLGVAISAGQAMGKLSANTLFNTSGVVDAYYKMKVAKEMEERFTAEAIACQKTYNSNRSVHNARKFTAAYKLMMRAYIESMDCTEAYLDESYGTGAINNIRAGIEDWTGKGTTYLSYNKTKQSIKSMRSDLSNLLARIESLAYNAYVDWLEYWEEERKSLSDTHTVESRKTSEFNLDGLIGQIRDALFLLNNQEITKDFTLGHDLETAGNLTLSSGRLNLNGHTLEIYGDMTVKGGSVDVHSGKLIVKGNLYHQSGTLNVNSGKVDIGGSYYIASKVEFDEENNWKSCDNGSGTLKMVNAADEVIVGKDFVTRSTTDHTNYLTAGDLKIGGNFYQFSGTTYAFAASGKHKTTFTGSGDKVVKFASTYSHFANVDFGENSIIPKDYLCWQNLLSDVTVLKDMTLQNSIDLNKHTLKIGGNLYHQSGTLNVNSGKVDIGGSYYIASKVEFDEENNWKSCDNGSGTLKMVNAADEVIVGKDFVTRSTTDHTNYLTAGDLKIGRNFYQFSGSTYAFAASGKHKTTFTGIGKQAISFESSSSHFATLQLTRPMVNYTFSRTPCWLKLIEFTQTILKLPNALKRIEPEAFMGISASTVEVPEGCTHIAARAFASCPNLQEVIVSKGCAIDERAFEGCGDVLISWRK